METLPVAVPEDGSGANPSSVKSEDSTPPHETNRGSPPPNCPICLGTCKNKCFTDSCLHQFCFKCLLTWSKVNAVCPLCKQNFKSIIHNVRSNQQYDEYNVEQRHPEETYDGNDIDNLANFTSAATRRFRYRTTLTLPRRHSVAFQQLLLQYPMMTDVMLPPPASRAPAAPPAHPAHPAHRRRDPYSFRRTVYRHNLWARPLPDFTGRFRNCTPEFYRFNETQTQRLVPWITRELPFLLSDRTHTSYVLSRLLDLLPRYHINSPEVRQEMQQYLGEHTEHFLHELYCFASTPYDLTGYDRNVQYTTDTRISSMVNEVISSSDTDASVDSDIVMVTSSEAGPSRAPAPLHTHPHARPPPDNVIPIETISHSDTDDDSSEVMVVGYLKPPRERTPEVVDLLGSDSDVILQDSVPPEPARGSDAGDARPAQPLVKLLLKRHAAAGSAAAAAATDSDSDDSTYTPPSPRARKRRRRSRASATTSDTCRTTPSPLLPGPRSPPASLPQPRSLSPVVPALRSLSPMLPAPRSPSPTVSRFGRSDSASTATGSSGYRYWNSSDTFSDASYTSSNRRKRTTKKKSRRKVYTKLKMTEKSKKKAKKTTPDSHHRDSKRKSHLGKGVKSSKKNDTGASSSVAAAPPAAPPAPAPELPSTSGVGGGKSKPTDDRSRRQSSRESRRLKSVVNVMNSTPGSNSSGPGANWNLLNILSSAILNPKSAYNSDSGSIPGEERTNSVPPEIIERAEMCFNVDVPTGSRANQEDSSDSEDNLPLNLTIKKSHSRS